MKDEIVSSYFVTDQSPVLMAFDNVAAETAIRVEFDADVYEGLPEEIVDRMYQEARMWMEGTMAGIQLGLYRNLNPAYRMRQYMYWSVENLNRTGRFHIEWGHDVLRPLGEDCATYLVALAKVGACRLSLFT